MIITFFIALRLCGPQFCCPILVWSYGYHESYGSLQNVPYSAITPGHTLKNLHALVTHTYLGRWELFTSRCFLVICVLLNLHWNKRIPNGVQLYVYMYSNGLLRMSCVVFCLRNCVTSKTLHTVKPINLDTWNKDTYIIYMLSYGPKWCSFII